MTESELSQLTLSQYDERTVLVLENLALFLDDLQWLDAATLDLLEDLLSQPDVHYLMLIGAYRNNEVNSCHVLMRWLVSRSV
jgi:predicted ATPase